jgi:outer membrane scaffolding protein for murein synthesis (MipA/OmpV family)
LPFTIGLTYNSHSVASYGLLGPSPASLILALFGSESWFPKRLNERGGQDGGTLMLVRSPDDGAKQGAKSMTGMKMTAGALLLSLILASPAVAQTDPEPVDDGGDTFTIGLGGSYLPSYEGSDDYVLSGAGLVRGRVSGFNFYTRATALYLDVIREPAAAPVNIEFGPMANLRLDRTSRIKDTRVRALGEIDTAIEAGAFLGVTKNGVLHEYDFLTARLDVTHDVTDTHDSMIVTPNLEYATPLSRTVLVGASLSADHVGGGFARTYFGVTPAGAAVSGLSTYTLDGGFKNFRTTLLGTVSLSGDLRRGWGLFAIGSYSRLLGDFKNSPIVREAGDADQFFAALGVSYTF